MRIFNDKCMKSVILLTLLSIHTPKILCQSDGFAFNATGGTGGSAVTVDNETDLLTYAASTSPYIITVSGTILLTNYLQIFSNKTIQGKDSNATIVGNIIVRSGDRNVIIRNLNITNPLGIGEGDGITVRGGRCVYINHCTFTDCKDGSCDIVAAADSITVSWCRFHYVSQTTHLLVNLIGSADGVTTDIGKFHVTFHHNWWDINCQERCPSVRYGTVHVYNNYYRSDSLNYCVRTRLYAEVLVENNFFDRVKNPWELLVTNSDPLGKLKASGNNITYLDTSFGVQWLPGWYTGQSLIPGTDSVFKPPYPYILSNVVDIKDSVTKYAGNVFTVFTGVNLKTNEPESFQLYQNYPNPFNPGTTIKYALPKAAHVTLTIYNSLGQEAAKLLSKDMSAGVYRTEWDASGFASGVYFYRIIAEKFVDTKKFLLLK
jgi:pectate lyase